MNVRKWLLLGVGIIVVVTIVAALIGLPAEKISASADTLPVELAGTSTFRGEFIESGYVFSDEKYNFCIAKATLVHVDGEQYELRLNEEDCGPRLSMWDLNITGDGEVSGTAWTHILHPPQETGSDVGELWLFTGCMMVGDYPAVTGTWDGQHLMVSTQFDGRCHGGKFWGDPEIMAMFSGDNDPESPIADGLDWDDGPGHMEFGIDLMSAETAAESE